MKSLVEYLAVLCLAPLCLACAPAGSPAQEAAPGLVAYDLEGTAARFEMPGRLGEISGIAMTSDGRLFGHNDERATVHEIDRETGEVGKRFSLGDPPFDGDFEGLGIAGDRFFLITSQGLLYEFREVGDRETALHRVTDTGLGATCEVEGLDFDARDEALLIACKVTTPDRGSLVVHRLPLDPGQARLSPIEIPRSQLTAFGLDPRFQASSVAVSPTGTLFLASAAPEALIEVDRTGRVLGAVELRRRRHPQPEGLAFGPNGDLYIADERNDAPTGAVTRYARVRVEGDPR